jgi:nuclear transport factor 2 (NTF2) superfamily protein
MRSGCIADVSRTHPAPSIHHSSGNWFRAYGNENWEFTAVRILCVLVDILTHSTFSPTKRLPHPHPPPRRA